MSWPNADFRSRKNANIQLHLVSFPLIPKMFSFGNDRIDFNNVVERGHLTLRHLLLKDWDASWETIPYPPAQGDFAVYDIANLKEDINYAVTNVSR